MALIEINFHSDILNMDTSLSLIIPETEQGIGLNCSKDQNSWKVLWLLHGRSDDHTIWMRRTSIERYAAPLGIMVIMPEVSYSRYLNMAYGPRYYDFMVDELPGLCHNMFPRMSSSREDTHIAGLSMGGGGALWIALHNPERFSSVCMLSTGGIAPLEHLWRDKETDSISDYKKTNLDVYGTYDSDSLEGTEYDIIKLIRDTAKQHTKLPKVFHAMGKEDVRYPVAMKLKETFTEIENDPYEYEYHESPGTHEWSFWDKWIQEYLLVIKRRELM